MAFLIGLADCIVIFVDNPSSGLLWEVEELIRAGAQHRSILLTRAVDVSPPMALLAPRYENRRIHHEEDAHIQGTFEDHLKEFPHRFDLQSPDLGARLASVIGGSRADGSLSRTQLEGEVSGGILSGSLRDMLPPEMTGLIVGVTEQYRVHLEAASIATDPYELFTNANLILGLSVATSDLRVAAYASECLSLAYAHYARPDISRITDGSKANARTISGHLSAMSSTYLSWASNDALNTSELFAVRQASHNRTELGEPYFLLHGGDAQEVKAFLERWATQANVFSLVLSLVAITS